MKMCMFNSCFKRQPRANSTLAILFTREPRANEMQMSDRKLYLSDSTKIPYSPNRTNRSNRQSSTWVPQYREIFLSVANEMQMSDRKLYLSDSPRNSLVAK